MLVYMLSAHEYSDWTILGVFSTREKAEAAKAEYERPYTPDWDNEPHHKTANGIQAIEVDTRMGHDFEWEHLKADQ